MLILLYFLLSVRNQLILYRHNMRRRVGPKRLKLNNKLSSQQENSGNYKTIFYFFTFNRSHRYRRWQKEKKLVNLQKNINAVEVPGVNPNAGSYIQRKSSEICKLLPKSPSKAVNIVKHLWNQMYKSPCK